MARHEAGISQLDFPKIKLVTIMDTKKTGQGVKTSKEQPADRQRRRLNRLETKKPQSE